MKTPKFKITKNLVTEINLALNKGLTKGKGNPTEGEMCVEALICFKMGLPHSDNPPCVGSEVRNAKISLNDCNWSSNKARGEGMRKLAIAQLGSNKLDQEEFALKLKLESMRKILPYLIQQYYDKLEVKNEKLLEWKKKFMKLKELDDSMWEEFYYNNYYNYNYYYNNYYYNDNYYNYNYYDFGDEFLLLIADTILSVLKKMKSPGCRWLSMIPKN